MFDSIESILPSRGALEYPLKETWIGLGRLDHLHKAEKSHQPERLQ